MFGVKGESGVKPAGGRQDMQDVAGQDLSSSASRKLGVTAPRMATKPHEIVDPSVLVRRRDDAERHADSEGDERWWRATSSNVAAKVSRDVIVDRPLGEKREPEVAVREPDDELLVLFEKRLVEAHLAP